MRLDARVGLLGQLAQLGSTISKRRRSRRGCRRSRRRSRACSWHEDAAGERARRSGPRAAAGCSGTAPRRGRASPGRDRAAPRRAGCSGARARRSRSAARRGRPPCARRAPRVAAQEGQRCQLQPKRLRLHAFLPPAGHLGRPPHRHARTNSARRRAPGGRTRNLDASSVDDRHGARRVPSPLQRVLQRAPAPGPWQCVAPAVAINGIDMALDAYAGELRTVVRAFPDYRYWELCHLAVDAPWTPRTSRTRERTAGLPGRPGHRPPCQHEGVRVLPRRRQPHHRGVGTAFHVQLLISCATCWTTCGPGRGPRPPRPHRASRGLTPRPTESPPTRSAPAATAPPSPMSPTGPGTTTVTSNRGFGPTRHRAPRRLTATGVAGFASAAEIGVSVR